MSTKERKIFTVKGRVIDQETRKGVKGLRVEAWDKDLIFDDALGNAITDEQGSFQVSFDESRFSDIFFDRWPDLYFKVYHDYQLIKNTKEDGVKWDASQNTTDITIEIKLTPTTPSHHTKYRVSGRVRNERGTPLFKHTVRAFDLFKGIQTELGTTQSNQQGSYEITFKEADFKKNHRERNGPNLIVSAYDQNDDEIGTAKKDNAPPDTVLNIDSRIGSGHFIVRGYIYINDKTTRKTVSDIKVQAFEKHSKNDLHPLGDTQSDENGFYQIEFSVAALKEIDLECDGPILLVQAFNKNGHNIGQSKPVRVVSREIELDIDVMLYRVHGTVQDSNQAPAPEIIVTAFDRDMRQRQQLGKCKSNDRGEYSIDYLQADFVRGDLPSNKTPWLIVEARKEPGGDVLAKQEFQKADFVQQVNLTVPGLVISEWQRLSEAIMPLLKGQGSPASSGNQSEEPPDLEPADLASTDVEFIVLETELARDAVEAWVSSSKMVRDAVQRLKDEHANEKVYVNDNGWQFFFSFTRQGLASDLDATLRESAPTWGRAWRAAFAANQVPLLDELSLQHLIAILELLQRLQQLDPVLSRDSDFVKVLAHTPLPTAVALEALTIFQEQGLNNAQAFLSLIGSHPEDEADIKIFVRGVRVHQLVSGHGGLSRLLNAHLDKVNTTKSASPCSISKLLGTPKRVELDSIGPLAVLPSTEWLNLAEQAAVNPGYALQLQAQVEHLHPLTALQARIEAENVKFPVAGGEIMSFIKKNEEAAQTIMRGSFPLAELENKPFIYKMLSNVGLFQRLGLNMEISAYLMQKGAESPGAAVGLSVEAIESILSEEGGYPAETAHEIANQFSANAEIYLGGINNFLTEMTSSWSAVVIPWLINFHPLPSVVRENLPDLNKLFGDLDECFCRPCESMLSQSAYLVDLLNLLKKEIASGFALKELSKRRPDIPDLKLNCENAENEMQHIVLVLEILEKAVKDMLPNTDAYVQTASAVFPWRTLPFDPSYETAKAYLKKLNVTRYDLLTLQADANITPMPDDFSMFLTAETLGFTATQADNNGSISDWELITKARIQNELWQAYGFSGDGMVSIKDPVSGKDINESVQAAICRISVLLDRTGLNLDELEEIITIEKDSTGKPMTKFVPGVGGELIIENRAQCKTSEMRLGLSGTATLEVCLDRLHRFVRLHKKLPDWSIAQLDQAIVANGNSLDKTPMSKLAAINRLNIQNKLPLEYLLGLPGTENKLRQALAISAQEYLLIKAMTGLDLSSAPVDWQALEKLCVILKRLRESNLTVEQVAAAVLPQSTLKQYLPLVRTSEQIEVQLKVAQQRLRSVEVIRTDIPVEAQVVESLTTIFGAEIANKLVNAITSAGAKGATPNAPLPDNNSLLLSLSGLSDATHRLGEWLPLLTEKKAREILTVNPADNYTANERFEKLLEGIALKRREKELVAVITEQCGLPGSDIVALLSFRLQLDADDSNQQTAFKIFKDKSFWEDPPNVSAENMLRLHAWMDRLYRLVVFSQALKLDSELMQFTDRIVVGDSVIKGIGWRDLLATENAIFSANFHVLLDFLWLQRAEQLSKTVLDDLFKQLDQLKDSDEITVAVAPKILSSLATRVGLSVNDTLEIAKHAVSSLKSDKTRDPIKKDQLCDPSKLRRVFELLLKAQHLGASSTELEQLTDLTNNKQAAEIAPKLVRAHARVDEKAWTEVSGKINDPLLQQKRDALVDYLVFRKNYRSANDLYEYYLIDPRAELCLKTTRLLEAITATQLFIQRILFGLERGITASEQLRNWWPWMRNYRVWEANRKVFLFPENWLYPELRDDKSTSFTKLESALGRSELTSELAQQAFVGFLDDITQIAKIRVVGLFEEVKQRNLINSQIIIRRNLYLIGRSKNRPPKFYWRYCNDFGKELMEWSPWQDIELEIQSDHILPFVQSGEFCLAWFVIKPTDNSTSSQEKDYVEITLNWSRFNGKKWQQINIAKDPIIVEKSIFREDQRGFWFKLDVGSFLSSNDVIFDCYIANTNLFEKPHPNSESVVIKSELLTDFSRILSDDVLHGEPPPNNITLIQETTFDERLAILDYTFLQWPDPSVSVARKISWSCWIKVKAGTKSNGWLEIRPSLKHKIELRELNDKEQPIPYGNSWTWIAFGTKNTYSQAKHWQEGGLRHEARHFKTKWRVHATFSLFQYEMSLKGVCISSKK